MIVEIIEDMPDADIVVVPIGGGRLIQNNYDFNILYNHFVKKNIFLICGIFLQLFPLCGIIVYTKTMKGEIQWFPQTRITLKFQNASF
jgi:hypothetical protein